MRRLILPAAIVMGVLAVPVVAHGSQLVDRNASAVQLAVNGQGEALVTFKTAGKLERVLAWDAVNAIAPTRARPQIAFSLDYSGGYGKYKRDYSKTFGSACGAYDGPALAWKVAACRAPDGSYWALQAWQRALANYGIAPTPLQAVWELRLSHWTGDLPVLTINTDWSYRRFDHMYGSFTYLANGVYGFRSTSAGVPLDTYGRNVYLDTFNSNYGSGWKRENSFLTHASGGTFCYGFYPHGSNPVGKGTKYRATIIGPGVTPDIMWQGVSAGAYDRTADQEANADQKANFADGACKSN